MVVICGVCSMFIVHAAICKCNPQYGIPYGIKSVMQHILFYRISLSFFSHSEKLVQSPFLHQILCARSRYVRSVFPLLLKNRIIPRIVHCSWNCTQSCPNPLRYFTNFFVLHDEQTGMISFYLKIEAFSFRNANAIYWSVKTVLLFFSCRWLLLPLSSSMPLI